MKTNAITKLRSAPDVGFCLKVSIAQAVSCLFGAFIPLIIDPKLLGHVRFGARHYPSFAYWLVPSLSVVILVVTFCLLAQLPKDRRIWWAVPPTWLFSLPMFWILRPEFPHDSLLNNIGLASILTTVAVWVRYHPTDSAYLDNPDLLPQAKLERVKEEISFWRAGFFSALGGYLALLVSWFNSMVKFNEGITPNHGEQFLLNYGGGVLIVLLSVWFLFGVIVEIAAKTRHAIQLLEKIPSRLP